MPTCTYPNCSNKSRARLLCSTHYKTILRAGQRDGYELTGHNAKGWLDSHGYHRQMIDGKAVRTHRYVMEQHLGRSLTDDENVHHKNGDRSDYRLENLELWNTAQPKGQRIEDKVAWANEILSAYEEDDTWFWGGC